MNSFALLEERALKAAFGRSLKSVLNDKRITPKEIEAKTGLKRSTVESYVAGESTPSAVKLVKLCEGIGISPNELLGW